MGKEERLLVGFAASLSGHDPKTIRTYLSCLSGFAGWLAQKPGGQPFRTELLTETAIEGYLDTMVAKGRPLAPEVRR